MLFVSQITFEGMEYEQLTRRFPCYAIRMGITHSDPSHENNAADAAKEMMVGIRYAALRLSMSSTFAQTHFLGLHTSGLS